MLEAQLDSAQELMSCKPDSALSVLQGVSYQEISSDKQKALYGLLLTQAKYKAFVSLDNDSIIFNSSLYYKGRDSYKYGLSLYYLGATHQEMEYYDMAMDDYLEALSVVSKSGDVKCQALIHNNLGQLYYRQYFADESLKHFKLAEKLFLNSKDTVNLGYMYVDMAKTCTMIQKNDSAMMLLNKALKIAQSKDDKAQIQSIYNNMTWNYLYLNKLDDAKTTSRLVKENKLLLAKIAIAEKEYDSALFFINIDIALDPIVAAKYKSDIYKCKEDYNQALNYQISYQKQLDSEWTRRDINRFDEISALYNNKQIINENEQISRSRILWIALCGLSFMLLVIVSVMLRSRHIRYLSTYQDLMEALRSQKNSSSLIELLNMREVKLRAAIEKRLSLIGELITISYEYKDRDKAFIKRFNELVSTNPLSSDAFNDIIDVVNYGYHNIIYYLKSNYPKLNDSELIICALTCVGFTSHQLFIILNVPSVEAIYNKKYAIGLKLHIKGDLKKNLDQFILEISNKV